MANYDQYKILTRKNTILSGGIKNNADEESIVLFENMLIDTSKNDDPKNVIIPTINKTLEMINELKDVTANVIYRGEILDADVLPTKEELKSEYESNDNALIVKRITTGEYVALNNTPGRQVELINEDGTTTVLTTISAGVNDGILMVVDSTGVFETAVFTIAGWQISNLKDTIPVKFEGVEQDINKLKAKDTSLDSDIASINARIGAPGVGNDSGIFLKTTNEKSVVGKGTLLTGGVPTGTPNEGDKIPLRSEVGSMGATLNNFITQAQADATKGITDAKVAQDTANAASNAATDADQKATQLEKTVNSALQTAQGIMDTVAKTKDGLAQELIDRAAADTRLEGLINTNVTAIAGKQTALTDSQKAVIAGEAFTTTLKSTYDGYEAKISQNITDIATNKSAIASTKAQSDLDHADVSKLKDDLIKTNNKAAAALLYGEDWNQGKQSLVRKDELTTVVLWGGADSVGQKQIKGLHLNPVSTAAGNKKFRVALSGSSITPAIDWTGIPDGCKAIANFIRTVQVTGGDDVNLWNDTTDQHFNDNTTIASPDSFYVFNTADTTDVSTRIGIPVNVEINKQEIILTFNPVNPSNNQSVDLTSAQIANIDLYTLYSMEFIGQGSAQVSGSDPQARQDIASLAGRVTTTEGLINGKQAALSTDQLAVVNGVPFTTALKTTYDGYNATITGKQDALSAAQLSVVNGESFTSALKTGYDATAAAQVKVNATDAAKALSAVTATEVLAGVAYVDAKVAAAGVPASVTTDLTQLKGVKVQKNGADLSTSQVALSALTSADLLVDKTYADAIVSGKQNSTLTTPIASATTVVGALTAIETEAHNAAVGLGNLTQRVAVKQNSTDNALTTTAKTITGAINEIVTWKTSATTELAKLSIDNTKLLELKTALGL